MLEILSAFLLANGNEMYCHSLIAMTATLEDKLKNVRFMEHAAGTTHLHNKGLTYADICDLAEPQYQEAKGVGKGPPAVHAKDSKALSSSFTQAKVHALVQCFQKGQSTSKLCNKSKTLVIFVEKGHLANNCLNKACFAMKPHSDTAKPNGCSSGPSRCPGHGNPWRSCRHCQEGHGEQQANKQSWKNIPPRGMESTKLVNQCTFHWCSKCTLPWWSTTHLMVTHTDYSGISKQNTNAQLLDFDATTWVINLPVHD